MSAYTRRRFLTRTVVASTFAFPFVQRARAAGSPNAAIALAVIGLGGKGRSHVKNVLATEGARLTALCDVDPERLAAQVQVAKEAGLTPFATTDARKILERTDVDAVIIATPNHWHATLAIWACRAGKDVYVEKPVSHDLWEGAQLAAVARQTGRIVQAGTQYRSDEGLRAAAAWIKEGHIGKPTSAHIVWYEYRPSIGRAEPHRPTDLDYDLYCGPAPVEPLTRPKLHYDWHWVWSTGDGDLGNSGVHPIDACRMLAGLTGLPRRALCLGGRFGVDDAGQTPNTQLTLLDHPGFSMLVENRNLPAKSGQKAMDQFRGIREGIALDCEGGSFVGLRGGGWIFDRDGKRVRQFLGDGGGKHLANFLDAVRSRRAGDLNAPILQGHYSAVLCHVGNLSWRLGSEASAGECRDAIRQQPEAATTFDQLQRHLAANNLDAAKARFTLGAPLDLDPATGEITAAGEASTLARARALARGSHRTPYAFAPA
ncbi:MAG: Gfo/Idh/MocA family oxidoreductase [Verrucomicrobia bacterium]|nr:Gfo/Idh/MocA family oxidoreductase [Verrucomicrobiota bacterium]